MNLTHPTPDEGAQEGTTGTGIHENVHSAVGSNVPSADTTTLRKRGRSMRRVMEEWLSALYYGLNMVSLLHILLAE